MPALELLIFDNIKQSNIFEYYPIFVETGTFMGETIFSMSNKFKELHTIEIKKEYYDNVKRINNTNSNINFYLGDSSIEIINICKNIKNNTVFFLDGHWSAGNTGKGNKDCPIYEELDGIMNSLTHKAIIIIDDVRLFGKGPNKKNEICNWEEINEESIIKKVESRLTDHYYLPSKLHEKDRLILHLNNI
tara:strand:- start:276 stop:845 length:570 start_codon:yes stop_codon:yes gene_type:complete